MKKRPRRKKSCFRCRKTLNNEFYTNGSKRNVCDQCVKTIVEAVDKGFI